ncbi:MAG: FAD-binding protein [Bacteroidota bacterium]
MKLSGWGRYPVIDSIRLTFNKSKELLEHLSNNKSPLIPYGNGRSYGDSALAKYHLPMRNLDRYLNFDPKNGILTCESGVLLSDIIETFLPRGWFPKVTPGTKLITVGGAIASDIHGKNHHVAGCFSECVREFKLLLPNNNVYTCSREENSDLFHATCGGMGLTGVIIQATIELKPVNSQWINQTTVKTSNLKETFEAFEQYDNKAYSVAWIDTLAKDHNLGRSILMTGSFADDGDLSYKPKSKFTVPFDFPTFALNKTTVQIFNKLYYAKANSGMSRQKVDIDSFFYPLDGINNWNRIYGKNGFVQYQFILPKSDSFEGLQQIINKIATSKFGSFLAVLKLYGPENKNYLSFPMEGYSLALDFKMQVGLIDFLHNLDEIVAKLDGRIYLAKDAVMDKDSFEQGYSQVDKFRKLRNNYNLNNKINSLQSERLGL